jgi:hypothetical protein
MAEPAASPAGVSAITGQLAVLNKKELALAGNLAQACTAWAHNPASENLRAVYEAVKAEVTLRLEALDRRRAALESQLAGRHQYLSDSFGE